MITRVRLDDAVRVRVRLDATSAAHRERLQRIERVRLFEHARERTRLTQRVRLFEPTRERGRVRDLEPKRLTVLELETGKCYWPVGRTKDARAEHLFCGATCRKGKVYCEVHERRAYDRRPQATKQAEAKAHVFTNGGRRTTAPSAG